MKFFGYQVLFDDIHMRKLKIYSDLEEGTAEIDKDSRKIYFHNFDRSFQRMLHKTIVEKFLWDSLDKFPEMKEAAFGSG